MFQIKYLTYNVHGISWYVRCNDVQSIENNSVITSFIWPDAIFVYSACANLSLIKWETGQKPYWLSQIITQLHLVNLNGSGGRFFIRKPSDMHWSRIGIRKAVEMVMYDWIAAGRSPTPRLILSVMKCWKVERSMTNKWQKIGQYHMYISVNSFYLLIFHAIDNGVLIRLIN